MDKNLVEALRSAGRGGDPDPAKVPVKYTVFARGNVAVDGEWREESLAAHAERRIAAGAKCLPKGRKLLAPTAVGARLRDGRRADAAAEAVTWIFFDADNVGEWDTLLSALSEAGIAYVASRSCSDGTPIMDASGSPTGKHNCKWHLYLPLYQDLRVDGPDFKTRRYAPELRHLYRLLVRLGGLSGCDESVDDLAQCAYVAMRPDSHSPAREVRHAGGALLDWDAALTSTAYVPPVAPPRSVPGGGTGPRAAGPRKAKGKQGAPGAAPAGGWDGGSTFGESAGTLAYQAAKGLGLLGPAHGAHAYLVLCPWRDAHSPGCPQRDRGEYHSSTVIYVGGSVSGGFTCKHAHCADKKIGDLLRLARIQGVPLPDRPEWGGASADDGDFETENDEPPSAATDEGPKGDEDVNATTKKKVHQNDSKSKSCPHLPAEIAAQLLRSAPTRAQMEAGVPGAIKPASANVLLILANDDRWAGVLWWDSFAFRLIKRNNPPWHDSQIGDDSGPGDWSKGDSRRLVAWLEMSYGFTIAVETATSCVSVTAKRNPHHPVKEYLHSLTWDGIPRLGTWLSRYLGAAQSRYTELAGSFWALGAVARIFEPGCKLDTMVVLEGGQGLGKSSALRILGGDWFADTEIDYRSKDRYQQIMGKWIYEISELAGLDKHEDSRVKGFLSSPSDYFRAPYDDACRDWPRSVAFAGSVNPDSNRNGTYLKDPTGGRRFWPVKCFVERQRADLAALREVRDQLWAEAHARYHAGEVWHATKQEENELFLVEQAARSVDNETDPWDQPIAAWISETCGGSRVYRSGGDYGQDQYVTVPLTPETLLTEVVGMPRDRQTQQARLRCGKALRRLGWRRADKTRRVNGVACLPYVPDLDEDGTAALSELCELAKSLPQEQKEWFRNTLFAAQITAAHVASLRAAVAAKLA